MDYAENHCALFLGTPFDLLSKKYVTTPRFDFKTSGIFKTYDRGAGMKKADIPMLAFMGTLSDLRKGANFPTMRLPIGCTDFRWTGLEEAARHSDTHEGHLERIATAGKKNLSALNNAFLFLTRNLPRPFHLLKHNRNGFQSEGDWLIPFGRPCALEGTARQIDLNSL